LWDLDPIRPHPPWKLPPGLGDILAFRSSSELLLCRFESVDGVHKPFDPDRFPRVVHIRDLLGPDPTRPVARLPDYQRINASVTSPDGRMFVLSMIREGPDSTRHVVTAIDSRTGEALWSREQWKKGRNGVLVMDPGGSYVAGDSGEEQGEPHFRLWRLADGEPVPTNPAFAVPIIPEAMGPGARLLACGDGEGPSLRLHLGEPEGTILRLGVDGLVHPFTAKFDREGRRIAWGQANGIVCVCDLPRVLGQLKEARLVPENSNSPEFPVEVRADGVPVP
jgi:hypothetical protein